MEHISKHLQSPIMIQHCDKNAGCAGEQQCFCDCHGCVGKGKPGVFDVNKEWFPDSKEETYDSNE